MNDRYTGLDEITKYKQAIEEIRWIVKNTHRHLANARFNDVYIGLDRIERVILEAECTK